MAKTKTTKAEKLGSEEKPKQTFSVEGEKIDVKACPNCKSELVVKTKKDGFEFFECDNCKFVKHDKKPEEKKEEKKDECEEFPDVKIEFDPFAQQT